MWTNQTNISRQLKNWAYNSEACCVGTFALLACAVAALVAGCQDSRTSNKAPGETTTVRANDGVTSEQILSTVVQTYASATSYRDRAILHLSYRLNGRLIEEPQRWSTTWVRDGVGNQRALLELFNAQVRADGDRLECYVYDIDTANLDNQQLIIPYSGAIPVYELFQDTIAARFLVGHSDLPLSETASMPETSLVPAPLSLLMGVADCPPCAWLLNVSQSERRADETLDDIDCYVVRTLAAGMTCDVWIDKATGLLVQISLPLGLLDPAVMKSDSITEIVLLARFHQAELNPSLKLGDFQLQPRLNATPVKQFVAVPEALPCEMIGQTAPPFELIQPDGKPVDRLHFDGKTTALLWLGNEQSWSAIGDLSALAGKFPPDKAFLGCVYSDSALAATPDQPDKLQPGLMAALKQTNLPAFYDPGLATSSLLNIKTIPAVVVLDGDSRIQFAASTIDEGWQQNLEAAIGRVLSGENIADEMLAQYEQFMRQYHQQLAQADASSLLPSGLATSEPAASTSVVKLPGRGATQPSLRPRLLWANDELNQPGNILVESGFNEFAPSAPDNRDRAFVLDGYQTVVELDPAGQVVRRTTLELPEGVGVSVFRQADKLIDSSEVSTHYLLFSRRRPQVFAFDALWRPVGSGRLLPDAFSDAEVLDVANSDGQAALVSIGERGIYEILLDASSGQPLVVSQLQAEVLFDSVGKLAVVDGTLVSLRDENVRFPAKDRSQRVQHVAGRWGVPTWKEPSTLAVTAVDADNQWNLVGLDQNLKKIWSTPIGSQFFDSQIEPLIDAGTLRDSHTVVLAVATAENLVHLIDADGKWLADINCRQPIRGLASIVVDEKNCILVSTGNRVECWSLSP